MYNSQKHWNILLKTHNSVYMRSESIMKNDRNEDRFHLSSTSLN